MRIIVSDTSCMIDLRKAGLLEAVLRLPCQFVMPDILFENEWLCPSDADKIRLRELGLGVRTLPGPLVEKASRYFNQHGKLTLNDCFALTLAEEINNCILLTGDSQLRQIAKRNGLEVRGTLWITDELEAHEIVPLNTILDALRLFQGDPLVFLPQEELALRIRRIARRLKA